MSKETAEKLVGILAFVAGVAAMVAFGFLPIAVGWYIGVGMGLIVACVMCVILTLVCIWLIVRVKSCISADDGS